MAEARSVVSSVQAAFAARTPPEKIGLALTSIIVLFLLADALPKIFGAQFSRTAIEALGFPPYQTALIGWVLLACVIAFAIARTAVLGAVGLTAYLGGAVAIGMHDEAWFPVTFAIGLGLLIWAALVLRRRDLLRVLIG